MTKLKSSYKNLLFIIGAILMLVALSFSCFTISAPAEASDNATTTAAEATSNSISVSVKNRQGENYSPEVLGIPDKFDGIDEQGYIWANTGYFNIGYTTGSETINANADGKYNYSLSVQFLQKRPTSDGIWGLGEGDQAEYFNKRPIQEFTGVKDSLSEIANFNYYVDKDENDESKVSFDYGWGLYRFTLTINQVNIPSILYYVEPSRIIEAPTVTMKEIESLESYESSYLFTITTESYKYVDQNLIRWYLKGEGYNGKTYCLQQADLGTSKFPSSEYRALFTEEIQRTGNTFELQTTTGGVWNVYCEIYDTVPTAENFDQLTPVYSTEQNPISVETGKKMNKQWIIWVIVGCGVVLLGVIIFIIVKSVKKEKVW